jgi:hypothetical protein
MTDLQIWLLIAPFVLVGICGGLAVYARYDADRPTKLAATRHNAAE